MGNSLRTLWTLFSLAALAACHPRQQVIPDNQQAHELAEDATVMVWVPVDKDTAIKVKWDLDAGDVCIRREVVEAEKRRRAEEAGRKAPPPPPPEDPR